MPIKKGRQQHYLQQKENNQHPRRKQQQGSRDANSSKSLGDSSKENHGRLQQQGACNS
jgi:hypothetical protein